MCRMIMNYFAVFKSDFNVLGASTYMFEIK